MTIIQQNWSHEFILALIFKNFNEPPLIESVDSLFGSMISKINVSQLTNTKLLRLTENNISLTFTTYSEVELIMDVVPPGNNPNNATQSPSVPPSPPVETVPPTIEVSPTVVSTEASNKSVNYLIPGILIALVFLSLASVIAIKIYQPNLLSWPSISFVASPTPAPLVTQLTASASAQPKELNSHVKLAFENAKKVLYMVDMNDSSVVQAALVYGYRGVVNELNQTTNVFEIVTGNEVPGLPNKWSYNESINIFRLPSFEKIPNNSLKINDKVYLDTHFTLKSDSNTSPIGQFNLAFLGLLPDDSLIAPTPILPAVSTASSSTVFNTDSRIEIASPVVKSAVSESSKIMDKIDLNNNYLERFNLIYTYTGKITSINQLNNNEYELTTDSKIKGLSDTWKYNNNTNTFIQGGQKISSNQLKVGDQVRLAIFFVVKGTQNFEVPNEFLLASIVIVPK